MGKREQFVTQIMGDAGLTAAAASITSLARSFRYTTCDDHAAHAVELIANRAGLRVLATQTDDGLHVVTVRGFSK